MEAGTRAGKAVKPGGFWLRGSLLAGLGLAALAPGGCTPGFYRKLADKEVAHVLKEKDKYPAWKIEQYHVYPDPLARFADPTKPDKPPMPPDDPAARDLAPNPQKPPHKGGVAKVEGDGYLQLLAAWDQINRALLQSREQSDRDQPSSGPGYPAVKISLDEEVQQVSHTAPQPPDPPGEELRLPDPETLPPPQPARDPAAPPAGGQPQPPDGSSSQGQGTNSGVVPPFLITADQAAELALINSREFQTRREDLYLAALPVTLERFAFAALPFLAGQTIREVTGHLTREGPHNRWRFNTDGAVAKLFPTGALLLFQFANRTIVELTGPHPKHTLSFSTLNLDIVHPFLRGAGQAVTLEPLTQVERNLVYEIRDYARFRKLFYVRIVGGADAPFAVVPTTFGGPSVAVQLPNVASGANVAGQIVPGAGGQINTATSGLIAPIQGYLPTLLFSAIWQNSRANVAALERILERFRAFGESGTIPQLQIDQVEQQLLQGRSDVLQRELDFRDSLDRFKLQLGVPTNLPLELDDGPLRPVAEHMRRYEQVFNQYSEAVDQAETGTPEEVRQKVAPEDAARLRGRLRQLFTDSAVVRGTQFRTTFPARWRSWEQLPGPLVEDIPPLEANIGGALGGAMNGPLQVLPFLRLTQTNSPFLARLRALRAARYDLLQKKQTQQSENQSQSAADQARLRQIELDLHLGEFERALRRYEQEPWKARQTQLQRERTFLLEERKLLEMQDPRPPQGELRLEAIRQRLEDVELELTLLPREQIRLFRAVINNFALVLVEAQTERLQQLRSSWPELPRVCLDGTDLLAVGLDEAQDRAGQAALINRFDLMNARAELVDAWRKICVLANALLGVFDVAYHLDSSTPPNEAQPLAFSGSRSRHQLILNYELPLVRKAERNQYRAGLISYQRQRRALMSFEDGVLNDVRSEIRSLRVLAENYKIQQRQVELAYFVRDNSFEVVLEQPADPTRQTDYTATTNQLLQAQNRLLTTQNLLYSIWINYLAARLQLYRDLDR
jgi:hypothetical protein